jgi:ABC-type Fe3+-hydroxamate transport system substrate-binding protein
MRTKWLAALVAAGALCTYSGCGYDDDPQPGRTAGTVTVEAENGAVEIEQPPKRIVSISAAATEDLFAVGAGDQVVAVDEFSTYPPSAPRTKLSYTNPNAEAIAKYRPDLVVMSLESDKVAPALERLKIPVLVYRPANDIEEAYRQIEQLGLATGHSDEARSVVDGMKKRVREIVERLRGPSREITVYHELDPTYFSATSKTFIGRIYRLLGLRNIADEAEKGGEYPQLSAEYVVKSDPDLIVLADTVCCGQDAAAVAKRPGMKGVSAVRNGDVLPVADDLASRWGPRVVDFMELVAGQVEEMRERP